MVEKFYKNQCKSYIWWHCKSAEWMR